MRIFITGASGFIGRAVCDALANHDCLALVRSTPTWSAGGIRWVSGELFALEACREELAAFKPEVCVHLAWAGLPDYSLATSRRNFEAGVDLLNLMLALGCKRTVVSGSCFEYGSLGGCVNEEQTPQRQGLFAAFKTAQRLVGTSLFADAGAALLWARPFFVYGTRQRATSLLPSAYRALLAGSRPDIRTPLAINDFIHVDDVASGLVALATGSGSSGVYNLGTGQATRVRDAVNLLAQTMGMSHVYAPSDETGVGYWSDQRRIEQDYGWKPRISLNEGIRRTVDEWDAGVV